MLCSLHFLDLVHRYATQAIAFKDGELVFEGLPKQIDDAQFKAIYGTGSRAVSRLFDASGQLRMAPLINHPLTIPHT